MFELKKKYLGVGLVLLSGLTMTEVVQAQTGTDDATATQLTAIAQAATVAQNEVKVTGNVETALKRTSLAPLYQTAIQKYITRNKNVQASLVSQGEGYTDVSTKLQVKNIQVNGNTATLEAIERTEYTYAAQELVRANKKYSYALPHRFTFVLQNGQWVMSSDKPLNGPDAEFDPQTNPPPAPPVPIPPNAVRMQIDPPNYNKSSSIPQSVASASPKSQTVTSNAHAYPSRSKSYKTSGATPQLFAQLALNRDAMVSYIYTYVFNYNPDYRNYSGNGAGGDCTNFASQILRAGGWSDVNGDYTNDSYWWYTWLHQSYTWVGAPHLYNFLNYSNRGTPMSHSSNLVVGDIIQVNFGQGEGLSHSMVVSTKKNDGTILVSYHSTDTLDRSLQDIINSSPAASFYAWHINDSFSSLPKPQTITRSLK